MQSTRRFEPDIDKSLTWTTAAPRNKNNLARALRLLNSSRFQNLRNNFPNCPNLLFLELPGDNLNAHWSTIIKFGIIWWSLIQSKPNNSSSNILTGFPIFSVPIIKRCIIGISSVNGLVGLSDGNSNNTVVQQIYDWCVCFEIISACGKFKYLSPTCVIVFPWDDSRMRSHWHDNCINQVPCDLSAESLGQSYLVHLHLPSESTVEFQ